MHPQGHHMSHGVETQLGRGLAMLEACGCFRDHKCCHVAQDFLAQDSCVTCHLSCVTMAFLATTGHLFIWFHASRVERIVLLEDGSTGERRVAFRRTTRPRASH